MATAVLTSTFTGEIQTPSKLSLLAKRVVNALVESRARSAARELNRRHAFLEDLGRRQDHSGLFLDQADLLPFKL